MCNAPERIASDMFYRDVDKQVRFIKYCFDNRDKCHMDDFDTISNFFVDGVLKEFEEYDKMGAK
jgi:hypothetical protein